MAMTVRFSTELDARLEALAAERQASTHALVVRAVEELLMRERKTAAVRASAFGEDAYPTIELKAAARGASSSSRMRRP